jgi:peroxiredoxin
MFVMPESQNAWAQAKAPEIKGRVWFNTGAYKKVNLKALRGKAVLLFFWTTDDSNCVRAAAILNSWYSQYQSQGLEIIGVHDAEWDFQASPSRVFRKAEELKIKFPVVLDDNFSIRSAYGAQAWPTFCLLDRGGYIRAVYYISFSYADIKKMLEALLEESESQGPLHRAREN